MLLCPGGDAFGAAPTIAGIAPDSGPVEGGTAVTIAGTDFTAAALVTIGGEPLVDPVVTVPDTITGVTPPAGAAGAVDVVVEDTEGTATLAGGFLYTGPPEPYSLAAFLEGFVEDFDSMGPAGTKAPGPTDEATYWAVLAAGDAEETAFTLDVADAFPRNYAFNMGYNPAACTADPTPPGCPPAVEDPDDRALGTYCGSAGDARWLETTLLNDTGSPFTGSLVISYDVEYWIERLPGFTAGYTLLVDGTAVPESTTFRQNVDEPKWSNIHWIDGNTVKDAVSVEVEVDIPADGILTLRWDGINGIPNDGNTRRRLGCGIDNLAIVEGTVTPAPTIDSITPTAGPLAGGTQVTILGTNFTLAAAVTVGGKPLGSPAVTVPDTITGTTPAGDAAGAVDVVITDAGGSATLAGGFTYEEDVGPVFRRGDANSDGGVNIADAIYILQRLFAGGDPILCVDAADSNDDEGLNLADAVYILQRLFANGAPIPAPGPDACGPDETGDGTLGCDDYPLTACPEP
jgi:hypothetical protein